MKSVEHYLDRSKRKPSGSPLSTDSLQCRFLDKGDVKNYCEYYEHRRVISRSWKPSVKNQCIISDAFFCDHRILYILHYGQKRK